MKLKLIKKEKEAKGTKSFFFEPEKKVRWLPGQYYYYTLPELIFEDSRGPTRHFTIANSQTEGNLLQLTTRIREESGYKKSLDNLEIGAIIEGEGPNGTFILDESETGKNHVFLAGGIGITPFRAFIKYNLDKNLNIPMHLIYSNSDSEFVFGDELSQFSQEGKIKSEFINTSKSGRLDKHKLEKYIRNWKLEIGNLIYWVVGPPQFTSAIEDLLEKLNISSDNIRTEKFTGY